MKNNKKVKYVDDGHTVYDMDGVCNDTQLVKSKKTTNQVGLTGKERRALIKSALLAYLPMFACVIICFALAMLLIALWLQ